MPEDELRLLKRRVITKTELLKEAERRGDIRTAKLLSIKLDLLKTEASYLESGGTTLKAPDDLSQIEFILRQRFALLEEMRGNMSKLPENDIDLQGFKEIEKVISAQCEYLSAKRAVISEERSLSELGRYIQLAEENGVRFSASPLEREADLERFKPPKIEKRKKEFVLDFRQVALIITVIFLIFSVYIGTSWRKTPYDREIIRSYVVARNHQITGNDYYTGGDFEKAIKEYAIAAAFFNRASENAELAAKSKSGKMYIYFNNKRKFFEGWEQISLKMIESSREFQTGDHNLAASHVRKAVEMAELAATYNNVAEEAWGLI
jgi:hypothetical protein